MFDSQVLGRFIHPTAAQDWDHVAMVRYRSRRDMLEMALEMAGKGSDVHKWAALERTQVFPVKPLSNLVWVRLAVALGLVAAALIVTL